MGWLGMGMGAEVGIALIRRGGLVHWVSYGKVDGMDNRR